MKRLARMVTSKFVISVAVVAVYTPAVEPLIDLAVVRTLGRAVPEPKCPCPYHKDHPSKP